MQSTCFRCAGPSEDYAFPFAGAVTYIRINDEMNSYEIRNIGRVGWQSGGDFFRFGARKGLDE